MYNLVFPLFFEISYHFQNRNGLDQDINYERPKTVRMVKRDSKDRIKSPNNFGSDDVPTLLPRGKNGNNNVHEFLNNNGQLSNKSEQDGGSSLALSKSSTLPRSYRSEDLKDLRNSGPVYTNVVKPSMIHGYKKKVNNFSYFLKLFFLSSIFEKSVIRFPILNAT